MLPTGCRYSLTLDIQFCICLLEFSIFHNPSQKKSQSWLLVTLVIAFYTLERENAWGLRTQQHLYRDMKT